MKKEVSKQHYFKVRPEKKKEFDMRSLLLRLAEAHGKQAEKSRQETKLQELEEEYTQWLSDVLGENDYEEPANKRSA